MTQFSEIALKKLGEITQQFPNKKSALMMTMRLAEEEFGYLDNNVCLYVANLLNLSPSHVMGLLSFYTHFRREYHGKHRIMVCCTLMCAMNGSHDIIKYLVNRLGINIGERTDDGKYSIEKCECIASCGNAPAMLINDVLYENLTIDKLDEILNSLD